MTQKEITLKKQYAQCEQKIQELKNKLYIDGKYEWIRDYYGDYPVYKHNKSLSTKQINELERRLRDLYFARNTIATEILNLN